MIIVILFYSQNSNIIHILKILFIKFILSNEFSSKVNFDYKITKHIILEFMTKILYKITIFIFLLHLS